MKNTKKQHATASQQNDLDWLTENQIAELAEIGNRYLYLGVMEEGRISYAGVFEIIKKYEEFRKFENEKYFAQCL